MNKSPKGAGSKQSPPDPKRKDRRSPSQDWLGEQLRDLYGGYAEEPLPEELQSLLERLSDSKPGGHGKGS